MWNKSLDDNGKYYYSNFFKKDKMLKIVWESKWSIALAFHKEHLECNSTSLTPEEETRSFLKMHFCVVQGRYSLLCSSLPWQVDPAVPGWACFCMLLPGLALRGWCAHSVMWLAPTKLWSQLRSTLQGFWRNQALGIFMEADWLPSLCLCLFLPVTSPTQFPHILKLFCLPSFWNSVKVLIIISLPNNHWKTYIK